MPVDSEFDFTARDGTILKFYRTSIRPYPPAVIAQINAMNVKTHKIKVRNAKYSMEYNCHGLTFVAKLGWFTDVRNLLTRHSYRKVDECLNWDVDNFDSSKYDDIVRGDIVVYYNGDVSKPTHTGVIWQKRVRNNRVELIVLSKWGPQSEYFHRHDKVPADYGKSIEIWTDRS